ncbi:CLIP domain-containing serine protease 14D-like [Ischnura elegans]|uniref:CLIP domain-containing serine protease 14D-like n=1 Tax=Ischnura elegans TaxID=197161 RepID=UPI001ED8AC7F|nr:CLIP domain-containing serine protease 14D-like [Ischnura elegans]
MTSAVKSFKRNWTHPQTFLRAGLLVLLLCDVPSLVFGCKKWEECLTVSECRKMQKQNNIEAMKVSATSILFPCDETLKAMTICCAVRQQSESSQTGYEVYPGYNISYEESAADSFPAASVPIPLPLQVKPNEEYPVAEATNECGLFRRGATEGDASRWQFPWLALLGKKNMETGEFVVDCGASLINNRHVLTSAYCLDNLNAPPEIVRLGEHDRSAGYSQETGLPLDYSIEKIIVHDTFNYPFLKNDIALIRLESSIPDFSDCIRPICLPDAPSPDSAEFIMAGWRTHGSRGVPSTSIPKFGPLSQNNSGLCDLPIPLQPLAETQMCFGSNPSSCYGDKGGPLVEIIKSSSGEKAVQAGIFSEGGAPCNARFAGELYTKVFPYKDWILKNIVV